MSNQLNNQMADIASIRVLDEAYAWLKRQRTDAPAHRPFWAMSLQWPSIRDQPRLVQYVKNWIRWAKTGVSLNVKALILKITEILY